MILTRPGTHFFPFSNSNELSSILSLTGTPQSLQPLAMQFQVTTILVREGTYQETQLKINKPLTIISETGKNTQINLNPL
jgi:hypothetical protein